MKFNNTNNKWYVVNENNKEKIVWESRSVAVNCVIFLWKNTDYLNNNPYVLIAERGPNAADFQGKMNIIAGYLDWNENGKEAVMREAWEEAGINIKELEENNYIISNNLAQPWSVKTDPGENRQNVVLRYGLAIINKANTLPKLSTTHNEVEGETVNPQWIRVEDINKYEWAFNHDKLILNYLNNILPLIYK